MSEAAFASVGGRSAFSEMPIGTTVDGVIVSIQDRQVTDRTTGEPKYWDKEKSRPQMQAVVTVETGIQAPDDDGLRSVYAKGKNLSALGKALREAGARSYADAVGRRFWGRYSHDAPAERGMNPAKIHEYKVGPAMPAAAPAGAALAAAESAAPPF